MNKSEETTEEETKEVIDEENAEESIDDEDNYEQTKSKAEKEEIARFKEISKREIAALSQQQDDEYESKKGKCEAQISELLEKYKIEEDAYSAQMDKDYQQSVLDREAILSSSKNFKRDKEKEFKLELETSEKKLKEIESDPAYKQTVFYKNTNSMFAQTDNLIESLNHKYFQLKKSVNFQRISYESELKSKLEDEQKKIEREMKSLPVEVREFIAIQSDLNEVKQSRIEIESELNFELEKLRENEKNLLTEIEYDQRMKEASLDDKVSQFSSLLEDLRQNCELELFEKENNANQEIDELTQKINERTTFYEAETAKLRQDIHILEAEIGEYTKNTEERSKSIQKETLREIQKEKDDFLLKNCSQKVAYQENIIKTTNSISIYRKVIKDDEIKHFIQFNQNLSQNNVSIDDLSKSNRAELQDLKYQLKGMKEFSKEQISVSKEKVIKMKELFDSGIPREEDQILIRKLEKQVHIANHRYSILMGKYNEAKSLADAKEKEYNRRFGCRPDFGILKGRPLLKVKNLYA